MDIICNIDTELCSHSTTLLVFEAIVLTLLVLQTDKRESVLLMALEHSLIGFITACISQWSTAGDAFSHSVTVVLYTSGLCSVHVV